MAIEHTQQQSSDEQERSQALSMKRLQPPTQVPGYEARRFLGAGAYGEVWVAIDRTTGRHVAIKFYAHRGGLDWSLLSREVEKLAFLSADRYVVQLLDVGWEAEPPYYVMEYIEHGSLEDRLKREGRLPASQAVALFKEVATGLLHAHAKGVLHCDLKPANVLLDQDAKPRLADFGQSRLSHEQTPALGTLFYMAPEQADLSAVPDVRWDVYALGALFFAMLTGAPPYKSDSVVTEIETAANLDERLAKYREVILHSPPPKAHRQTPGVDRDLAEIVDGCLAVDRAKRFANVQEVLDALEAREQRRARRSLLAIGTIGPAIVLAVMSVFAWWGFESLLSDTDDSFRTARLAQDRYAAQSVAGAVRNALERRYQQVEDVAQSGRFQTLLTRVIDDPELAAIRVKLSDQHLSNSERETVLAQFQVHPLRVTLQERLQRELDDDPDAIDAAWIVTDPQGLVLARAPQSPAQSFDAVGDNLGWHTLFHGQSRAHADDWRPEPDKHVRATSLSSVFRSPSGHHWRVAVSSPISAEESEENPYHFLGVVAKAINVDRLANFPESEDVKAVLVDMREGDHTGLILQHPLYLEAARKGGDADRELLDRSEEFRLAIDQLPDKIEIRKNYRDPLGALEVGAAYDTHWLADWRPVSIRDGNTGWIVIVQEAYETAIGRTLNRLKSSLWSYGLIALGAITILVSSWIAALTRIWTSAIRPDTRSQSRWTPGAPPHEPLEEESEGRLSAAH